MRSTDLLRRYIEILDEAPVTPMGASADQQAVAAPGAAPAAPPPGAKPVTPDPNMQAKMMAQQALDRQNKKKEIQDQIKQTQEQIKQGQTQLQELQKQLASVQ